MARTSTFHPVGFVYRHEGAELAGLRLNGWPSDAWIIGVESAPHRIAFVEPEGMFRVQYTGRSGQHPVKVKTIDRSCFEGVPTRFNLEGGFLVKDLAWNVVTAQCELELMDHTVYQLIKWSSVVPRANAKSVAGFWNDEIETDVWYPLEIASDDSPKWTTIEDEGEMFGFGAFRVSEKVSQLRCVATLRFVTRNRPIGIELTALKLNRGGSQVAKIIAVR